MALRFKIATFAVLGALALPPLCAAAPIVYEGESGPGKGKHIVLIAGDQEYRSEEAIPMLARILARRHGFKCTALFAINPKSGEVDPSVTDNVPGLDALRTADLVVLFLRFLELPDEQMKEIVDYTNSGRPIVALRTSTHPFNYQKRPGSAYAKYHWKSADGGYGRQVLGETWVSHHGIHEKESTRGVVAPGMEDHPILKGVSEIWGESDVYEITTLAGDSVPLVLGQVLRGMTPGSPPNTEKKLMPVAWTKSYAGASGRKSRIFTTTMGHANDFRNEEFRRMVVNACYWAMGLEGRIPARGDVEPDGPYKPNPIGIGKHKQGLKLSDFRK
ncbi:MAG: ThuA domain-containing protein [Bryobacteraceae bacterium]|nr:ThuA domain-containing protein [Bryobacteraceae bacterium]